MEKVEILGVGIDNLSLQEVLETTSQFLNSPNQHFIVTANPEFLVAANADAEFKKILNYADIATSDGIGLLYAAKFLKQKLVRVTGVDLVWNICELASDPANLWPVYFVGAADNIAQATSQILSQNFPNLKIAGAQSGGLVQLDGSGDQAVINQINQAKPKIIFAAFGQAKQEKWIFKNLDKLPSVRLAIGVGGAFDYISGSVPRAPKFLQQLGLEWLHRLITQPERWKRIFNATVVFSFLIIKKRLLGK